VIEWFWWAPGIYPGQTKTSGYIKDYMPVGLFQKGHLQQKWKQNIQNNILRFIKQGSKAFSSSVFIAT